MAEQHRPLTADLRLRPVREEDAGAICAIYNPFIVETIVSFELNPVAPDAMVQRIRRITAEYPWLVAERADTLLGYAYATRWRTRAAYDHTVECAIYVHPDHAGTGVGRTLYTALLDLLRARGVHAAIGAISLPNEASVRFHERCGFTKVGHFPQVGRKFDRWVDVGFWQVVL